MLDMLPEIATSQERSIRERVNAEMKEQIMRHAELICKALDDKEALIKRYEDQCRVLAAEVDRLTTAS